MTAPALENMDLACARAGKIIAEKPLKELENLLTDALGVLEEQGVYALFLYLNAHSTGRTVSDNLHNFLKETLQQSLLLPGNNIFAALQNLGEDLDNLLLARDLLRQTLVYARHHAKLRKEKEPEK